MAETRIENGIEWFIVASGPDEPGREDCQCARCGSSAAWANCGQCEDGYNGSACIDDLCHGQDECIHGDDELLPCDFCLGTGGSWHCVSDRGWCIDHPLPGRENIDSTAFADARAWND